MADANAKPTSSCGDGTTVTDRGCTVSKQTDCEGALEKVAHKNNVLPNGCLKHSLEENGRVRLLENAEDTSVMLCGNSEDSEAAEASSCNAKCECEHVSNCSGDSTVNAICVNNKVTGQNGDHNSELANDESSIETCCKGIADVSLAESSNPSEGCSPELVETVAECNSNVSSCGPDIEGDLEYVVYESELQMPDIMRLITKDLSEPYSIYTYRYFIHNWPRLCFLAMDNNKCVGAIVCKHDLHKKMVRRGYIAMLAVDQNYRRRGIGSHLVMKAIRAMVAEECDEVVLETEITNKAALRLYENLGFLRDKRLFRYYLNGVDALRLKLWLR